mmetsp:Transcript_116570/g.260709  ORF Transcript_116570/g.260709 Transcript_116570/m.260709 type:complete len:98 (+) Transcript_116570:706-999(+)
MTMGPSNPPISRIDRMDVCVTCFAAFLSKAMEKNVTLLEVLPLACLSTRVLPTSNNTTKATNKKTADLDINASPRLGKAIYVTAENEDLEPKSPPRA